MSEAKKELERVGWFGFQQPPVRPGWYELGNSVAGAVCRAYWNNGWRTEYPQDSWRIQDESRYSWACYWRGISERARAQALNETPAMSADPDPDDIGRHGVEPDADGGDGKVKIGEVRFEVDPALGTIELQTAIDDVMDALVREVIDTKEQATRAALIKLGWTPPLEKYTGLMDMQEEQKSITGAYLKKAGFSDAEAQSMMASGTVYRPATPATVLPTGSEARKAIPIGTGFIDYFPAAIVEAAKVSKAGNDKHNPGQPLHHARGKSMDHADCIMRHFIERGTIDPEDGLRHTAKLLWRVGALLQEEMEAAGAPLARAAKVA